MSNFKDLTSKKFGKLTVIKFVGKNKWGNALWLCRCDCGIEKPLSGGELNRGTARSCGCSKGEFITKSKIKHNMANTRFYKIWESMKRRCDCRSDKSYERYGGRGINYQKTWTQFINFKNDMYESYVTHCIEFGEKETTLDRKNYNIDYLKSNCQWATMKEQQNNRSSNKTIIFNHESLTLSQVAEKYNLPYATLSYRIRKGWSTFMAINMPIKKYNGGVQNR